ncbi:MAG: lipid-A-disaccharide synthase [Betaproteobacteria bacterium]
MRLVTVTGEASGDLIAAEALRRLSAKIPQLELGGIGGDRLAALGMECWFRSDDLAVRGYAEAVSKLVHILAVRYWLLKYTTKWAPRVYLGVDAPDFNLGVEARIRQRGIRTVHLISPSIWAWRPERITKIKQAVDHMLCIFPFETQVYAGTGVQASYVGHPIADMIPLQPDAQAAREALSISGHRAVVAVLHGSRMGELKHNGPELFRAAAALARDCEVVIPAASAAIAQKIDRHPEFRLAQQQGVRLLPQQGLDPISHLALAACDVALVASGTATLEAALFKRPMVIAYRVPALTYWMMRRRALIQDIGLPNILLGSRAVPELIQQEAQAPALAAAVRRWLDDAASSSRVREQFAGLHQDLRLGAAQRIADILDSELAGAGRR